MFNKAAAASAALIAAALTLTGFAPAAHAANETLQPTLPISVAKENGRIGDCTLGFVFMGADGRPRALTAGHCGEELKAVTTPGGVPVGVVAANGLSRDGSDDISIIDLHTALQIDTRIPGVGQVDGFITPDEMNRTRPLLCKKGVTTGLSCGQMIGLADAGAVAFHGSSQNGDSGSPVYAVTAEGRVLAAGILRGHDLDKPDVVYAVPIAPYLQKWSLSV